MTHDAFVKEIDKYATNVVDAWFAEDGDVKRAIVDRIIGTANQPDVAAMVLIDDLSGRGIEISLDVDRLAITLYGDDLSVEDREAIEKNAGAIVDHLSSCRRKTVTMVSAPDTIEDCLADLAKINDRIAAINARLVEDARLRRLAELKAMPYQEYLRSPEWLATRARMLEVAGDRCQVCNAGGVTLNTHHRTYERRGEEPNGDLFVLCSACHQIFHDNGKLARPDRTEAVS